MLTNCASNIVGTAFPYGLGIAYQPGANFFTLLNFRQGLTYNPIQSLTACRDISFYNVSNFVANNVSATDYYPNRYGGMLHLNNTTGYNPGAGKYISSAGSNYSSYGTTEFTFIVSWQYISTNATYGADIIIGAYTGSTHDFWVGTSGYSASPYIFSRNGSSVSSGITPVAGRRYITLIGNSQYFNSGYFALYSSAGESYVNTGIGGVNLTTCGSPALGKYGGWNDNYLPNVLIGDWLSGFEYSNDAYPQGFTYAKANAILQSLKPKLGIP
jgi:hypothetical protein